MSSRKRLIVAFSIILLSAVLVVNFIRQKYVVPIIMYHSVNLSASRENRLVVSTVAFERQMRFLKEHRYNILPLDEAVTLIRDKKKISPHTIAITFDDGFKDNYTYAFPILKKYNLCATIFIIVNEVGSPDDRLSWDEIKTMQNSGLITFGSHTLSHPHFASFISEEELRKQIFDSKKILEEKLKRPANVFCYPFGEFNFKIKQLVKDAGYKLALATYRGGNYLNNDIFALRRIPISENDKNLFFFWIKTASPFYNYILDFRYNLKLIKNLQEKRIFSDNTRVFIHPEFSQ